jgi:hypothetical protein
MKHLLTYDSYDVIVIESTPDLNQAKSDVFFTVNV